MVYSQQNMKSTSEYICCTFTLHQTPWNELIAVKLYIAIESVINYTSQRVYLHPEV